MENRGDIFKIENRFFSYNTSQQQPSTAPSHSSYLDSLKPYFLFRKEQASKRCQPNRMKQDTARQRERPHNETLQSHPIGGKEI